jgi:hypothetical protein
MRRHLIASLVLVAATHGDAHAQTARALNAPDSAAVWMEIAERVRYLEQASGKLNSDAVGVAESIADSVVATKQIVLPLPLPKATTLMTPAPVKQARFTLPATQWLIAVCSGLLITTVLLRLGMRKRAQVTRSRAKPLSAAAKNWSAATLLENGSADAEMARTTGLGRDAILIYRRMATFAHSAETAEPGNSFRAAKRPSESLIY